MRSGSLLASNYSCNYLLLKIQWLTVFFAPFLHKCNFNKHKCNGNWSYVHLPTHTPTHTHTKEIQTTIVRAIIQLHFKLSGALDLYISNMLSHTTHTHIFAIFYIQMQLNLKCFWDIILQLHVCVCVCSKYWILCSLALNATEIVQRKSLFQHHTTNRTFKRTWKNKFKFRKKREQKNPKFEMDRISFAWTYLLWLGNVVNFKSREYLRPNSN